MQDDVAADNYPWRILGAYVVLLVLVSLPVLLNPVPLLNDYPQHIARVYILAFRDSSPFLQAYYQPDWGFQANLATEAILLPLSLIMPVELAGRIFLLLIFFSLTSGVLFLHRVAHRRWSIWPLLAFFFVYNRVFLGGIISYMLMLGLAGWATAIWILLRQRGVLLRIAVSTPIALLLLVGHLAAFAVYAFAVAGYELWQHFTGRARWYAPPLGDLVGALAQFVVAACVFLLASTTSGNAGALRFDFVQKLTAPFNLFYDYHLAFDAACLLLLVAVVAVGLLQGWVKLSGPLAGSVVALVVAYAAMPYVMFGSHGADRRLTVAVALFAIAATDWRPALLRWRGLLVGGLALMLAGRLAVIQAAWSAAQPLYRQYLAALDSLPIGARLGVLFAHNASETLEYPPVQYVAEYAIIQRQALVSSTFTAPGAQPLRFSPPYDVMAGKLPTFFGPGDLRELRESDPAQQPGPYVRSDLAPFDYVLVIHGEQFHRPVPDWLVPTAEGPDFRLFRVAHP